VSNASGCEQEKAGPPVWLIDSSDQSTPSWFESERFATAEAPVFDRLTANETLPPGVTWCVLPETEIVIGGGGATTVVVADACDGGAGVWNPLNDAADQLRFVPGDEGAVNV
jgi:hypothetical protein